MKVDVRFAHWADELEELPRQSIGVDPGGCVWQKKTQYWYSPGEGTGLTSEALIKQAKKVAIIYMYEEGSGK